MDLLIFNLERCLPPIEPFGTVNRYETAALSGLVMIEVLTTLEHVLIDISQLWRQGVLKQFLDRALVPFLYRSVRFTSIFTLHKKTESVFSIVYYPIFVPLQQKRRRC